MTAVMIFGLANSTTTHPYYLVGLAVPMAAVMGIGFAALWRTFGKGDGLAWLLPGAMAGAVLYQVVSSRGLVADWPPAMALVIVATGALGMGVAIWRGVTASPLSGLFVTLGALAVLAIPVGTALQAGGPIAGPAAGTTRGLPPPRGSPEGERTRQVASYIGQQGHGGSAFTVAALSAREAAPFIIAGVPALAIGGFSGNDPVFTLESFLAMTGRGEVRYFLMQGSQAQGQPQGQRSQEAILSHVRRSWQDVSAAAGLQPSTLYRFPGPGP
ncbi:MAG: hypothetical protein HYU29_01675 [Chloroflexi bacterium]|nr:hypothetical protein [Chloroflexota bacterium]